MTDQTQTTTEPVDSSHGSVYDQLLTLIHDRDHALRGDERTDPNEIDETVLEIMRITTPQPLAIGLNREAVAKLVCPKAFEEPTPNENRIYQNDDYRTARDKSLATADAILALAAPADGYVLVPVDRLRDIVTLSSFLRQGGCDAEDLAGLEYAVESAVDIASACLPAAPTGETL